MKMLDDSVAETEQTERGIALSHGSVIDRMLASACSVIVLPAFGVLMCSYILACSSICHLGSVAFPVVP